jgi:hypothetical protein
MGYAVPHLPWKNALAFFHSSHRLDYYEKYV